MGSPCKSTLLGSKSNARADLLRIVLDGWLAHIAFQTIEQLCSSVLLAPKRYRCSAWICRPVPSPGCIADYNDHLCDRGETDIIKASEAFVSGSIPDGRTSRTQTVVHRIFAFKTFRTYSPCWQRCVATRSTSVFRSPVHPLQEASGWAYG